jgi:hypothetical protein
MERHGKNSEPMDAVGTIIAERPPHRTVRARLRTRLPPWMSGEEAGGRIKDAVHVELEAIA